LWTFSRFSKRFMWNGSLHPAGKGAANERQTRLRIVAGERLSSAPSRAMGSIAAPLAVDA
jgi:hypothetical protein